MPEKKCNTLNGWRKERGLAIAELARRAGLEERQLEGLLYRGTAPSITTVLTLAQTLSIEPTQFLWRKKGKE